MVIERRGPGLEHRKVSWLPRLLEPGDLLVINDTKVVPARIWAKKTSGGRVEILLLNPARPLEKLDSDQELHQCLFRANRPLKPGQRLLLEGADGAWAQVERAEGHGKAQVLLNGSALDLAERCGATPLPPYISRPQGPNQSDGKRYQTVYANRPGAVAAPTAGLHFSGELMSALRRRGVEIASLTLHVGYGTFAEPRPEDLAAGRLHAEWVDLPAATSQAVARTKAAGGRVIAVGTTSLRALEWRPGPGGVPRAGQGWCDLLIGPGHDFRVADGIMTNFHLPRTTLLMLVSALAGRKRILAAYDEAVREGYRFYSYGDAMLIV